VKDEHGDAWLESYHKKYILKIKYILNFTIHKSL